MNDIDGLQKNEDDANEMQKTSQLNFLKLYISDGERYNSVSLQIRFYKKRNLEIINIYNCTDRNRRFLQSKKKFWSWEKKRW